MPLPAGKIDVHHHCLPEFYKDVQRAAGIGGTAYQGFPEWTPEKSLELMDRLNIAATVFSFTSPGIFFGDVGQTRELAIQFNDYLASLKRGYDGRFGGFAFLPLPDVGDDALEGDIQLVGRLLLAGLVHGFILCLELLPSFERLHRVRVDAVAARGSHVWLPNGGDGNHAHVAGLGHWLTLIQDDDVMAARV